MLKLPAKVKRRVIRYLGCLAAFENMSDTERWRRFERGFNEGKYGAYRTLAACTFQVEDARKLFK